METKTLKIKAIKTDIGYFVQSDTNARTSYSTYGLEPYLFNGKAPENTHNRSYITAKQLKAGHLFGINFGDND